jgi:hypothetical protein
LDVGYVEQQVGIAHDQTQLLNNNLQPQRKQYGSKHCITSTIHATMGDTLNRVAIEMSKDDPSSKLWDRVQVVVALSRTQFAKDLIFVGRKASTTKALVDVLKIRSQWSDCIEDILALVMVNEENVHRNGQWQMMTQRVYPFRICDVVLPQCRTGYVYFLISLCSRDFTYIGQTICLCTQTRWHNNGYESIPTEPVLLCLYAVMGYICGFNGNKHLREMKIYIYI